MQESSFKFDNPIIQKILLCTNDQFDESLFDGIGLNTNTDIQQLEGDNKAIVRLHITLGGEEKEYPFVVECIMTSVFSWDDNTENPKLLLEYNAPALLLSYARPYISLLTAGTKYPALNIPFMNFKDNKEKNN